jgi:hypothetical protein
MDCYLTLLKAKFGVTIGGYKTNKTKVQMNQYNNFGDTLNYHIFWFQYFLKYFLIACIEYWKHHHVKFRVYIVLRCSDGQRGAILEVVR